MANPAHLGSASLARASKLMDAEALKQWILRRLGAPFLKVEMTEDNLEDAVETARRWFVAKKGVTRYYQLPLQGAMNEYNLIDDVDTVTDVVFTSSPMDLTLVFSPFVLIDEKVPYDVFAAPASGGLYSSLVQTLQYIDTAKRVLGAEADWRQEGRRLYIMPTSRPDYASSILVEYKSRSVTIEQLTERDHDLVKRMSLAQAKLDVGRIRSKYDSFPTAQGAASLDGATLLDEARVEIEKLEEEIADSAYPIPPMLG